MNNASQAAFRSHLMQQFVKAAATRGQQTSGRYNMYQHPIALMGWINNDNNNNSEEQQQQKPQKQHHSSQKQHHSKQKKKAVNSANNDGDAGIKQAQELAMVNESGSDANSSQNDNPSNSTIGGIRSIVSSTSTLQHRHPYIINTHNNSTTKIESALQYNVRILSTLSSSNLKSQDDDHDDDREVVPDPKNIEDDDNNIAYTTTGNNNDDMRSKTMINHPTTVLSEAFQTLIQTRRTAGKFHPIPTSLLVSNNSLSPLDNNSSSTTTKNNQNDEMMVLYRDFWKSALERAVIAGCSAPNHKRTEPFTFKRIIKPSIAHERLADIAYHVNIQKQQQEGNNKSNNSENEVEEIITKAQRKRERWSQTPAYLVTVVNSSKKTTAKRKPDSIDADDSSVESTNDNDIHEENTAGNTTSSISNDHNNTNNMYQPLPYIPPGSERELEDYAATCAAVQNCLLSLHAEQLVTKWATGSIIRTPAFRQLIHAQPNDRVVALIMIGGSSSSSQNHSNDNTHNHKNVEVNTTTSNTRSTGTSEDASLPPTDNNNEHLHYYYFPPGGRRRRLRRGLHGDLLVDL